jgi:hypothetical protein
MSRFSAGQKYTNGTDVFTVISTSNAGWEATIRIGNGREETINWQQLNGKWRLVD